MPLNFAGQIIGSGIAAGASITNTRQVNENNLKIARETNQANREMVDAQNKAAAAESEKAYNRSKAANQVGLMQSAGMSRAGAINAINGGGSYTPAPVNTSQDSSPQMQTADLSALANIGQAFAQRAQQKHDEKMAKMQIEAQKEENAANRQNAKDIAQISADASKYGADKNAETSANMLAWEKQKYDKLPEYEKDRYRIGTELLSAQKDMEVWRVNDLKYRVLEYQSKEYKSTRDSQNLLEGIAADMDYALTAKDMQEFRDTYMYFDADSKEWKYKPATNSSVGNWLYENAPRFWDFAARVLPANKLGDVISRALGSSKKN